MAMKEFEMADVSAGAEEGDAYFGGGGGSGVDAGQLLSGGKLSDDAGGAAAPGAGGETVWCGCLSLAFYQQFFRVDTKDVTERWLHSILSWRRETGFLDLVEENPDAYGPFWNSTSLIFLIALTTNISNLSDGGYDLNSLVIGTWIVYGFAAGAPVLVWLVLNQLNAAVSLVQLGCMYGYSLGPYLPAVLLCGLPIPYLSLLSLAAAGTLSVVFLLRGLTPVLLERNVAVATPVMAGLGVLQVLFTLVIKVAFF